MWRPKDWWNPFLQQDSNGNWVDSKSFELGADAMLKALRNNQCSPFDKSVMSANFRGRLVIIPDEQRDGGAEAEWYQYHNDEE